MKEAKPRMKYAKPQKLTFVGAVVLAAALLINHLFPDFGFQDASPLAEPAHAKTQREAKFDYYVLALSWSPAHCLIKPGADQCKAKRRFIMHGLWPQFERGFPTDCPTRNEKPNRRLLREYRDLTGSEGLLAYQWRKHGVCAGLPAEEYLAAARRAVQDVKIPDVLLKAKKDARVDPRVFETAFIQANPQLTRDSVTIKCKNGDFSEVRICLTKDLEPRRCGRDVIRDCSAKKVDFVVPN